MDKDKDSYELLVELINHNIVKKLPPQKLTDFIGEFNYIHSMLDDVKQKIYDPSMALIRQLVTEYIIFPLGSELVRSRMREKCTSFLFYGPPGTGKTITLVEAMKQVLKKEPSARIIAAAPSNAAADLMAERLKVTISITFLLDMLKKTKK